MSTPQINAKKHFLVKFVLALTVVCINHETRSDGALSPARTQLINFISSNQHWKEMPFVAVNCESGWLYKNFITGNNAVLTMTIKLKNIPYLMGCGYGQQLYDFLWLTIHTADVCKSLSATVDADDCWSKLKASVENGVLAVTKLVRTLELIDSFEPNKTPNPYFEIFSSVQTFLKVYDPRRNYSEEVLNEARQTIILANSLGEMFNSYCAPKHDVFVIDKLIDEYSKENAIQQTLQYDFYVSKLNSYMRYISKHLLKLGFYFNARRDKMSYEIPF